MVTTVVNQAVQWLEKMGDIFGCFSLIDDMIHLAIEDSLLETIC